MPVNAVQRLCKSRLCATATLIGSDALQDRVWGLERNLLATLMMNRKLQSSNMSTREAPWHLALPVPDCIGVIDKTDFYEGALNLARTVGT